MALPTLTASQGLARIYPALRAYQSQHAIHPRSLIPMGCSDCKCISQYQYNLNPKQYEECVPDEGGLCGCFAFEGAEYCLSGQEATRLGNQLQIPLSNMKDYIATQFGQPKRCVRESDTRVREEVKVGETISVRN